MSSQAFISPSSLLPFRQSEFHFSTSLSTRSKVPFISPVHRRSRWYSKPIKSATTSSIAMSANTGPLILAQAIEPLPDDTAVDMITFALSGPGWVACAAVASVGLFFFLSFGEFGSFFQRKRKTQVTEKNRLPYMLRIELPERSGRIEFPEDGVVREISQGESIFQFSTLQSLNVVAGQIEGIRGAKFSSYKLDGMSVRTLSTWPPFNRPADVQGLPPNLDERSVAGMEKKKENPLKPDLQKLWDEYEQIGAFGSIDKEWTEYVKKNLATIEFETKADNGCKLCGGSGFKKCHRCGGVAASSGSFKCDCVNGQRPCDWCSPS